MSEAAHSPSTQVDRAVVASERVQLEAFLDCYREVVANKLGYHCGLRHDVS